jgi:hypothetical protein
MFGVLIIPKQKVSYNTGDLIVKKQLMKLANMENGEWML